MSWQSPFLRRDRVRVSELLIHDFPVALYGSAARNSMCAGTLNDASAALVQRRMSSAVDKLSCIADNNPQVRPHAGKSWR